MTRWRKKIDKLIVEPLANRALMARDLRVFIGFSKAVTDLERIGDAASRIAHIATSIYVNDQSNPSIHLSREAIMMGKIAYSSL